MNEINNIKFKGPNPSIGIMCMLTDLYNINTGYVIMAQLMRVAYIILKAMTCTMQFAAFLTLQIH